jgi:nicotinamide-nucleotide amidase
VTIATAESCTGGLISVALTDEAGSSDVFERGYVTYSNTSKIELLGVRENTLQSFGAVSEEVAREMAQGARTRSGASLAVSVTGIAGPGGSENKPEGRVCFAISHAEGGLMAQTVDFGALGRGNVRRTACTYALGLLQDAITIQ